MTAHPLGPQLARRLKPNPLPQLQQGVVTAVGAATVDLTLAGSAVVAPGVPFLESYPNPAVGDTVWVWSAGAGRLAIAQAGARHCSGTYSGTTDASGNLTIPHALGVTPTSYQIVTSGSVGGQVCVVLHTGKTSTTLTCRIYTLAGATANLVAAVVMWEAEV